MKSMQLFAPGLLDAVRQLLVSLNRFYYELCYYNLAPDAE